jgi:hypothetical protein
MCVQRNSARVGECESGRREVTSHKTHAHSDTLPLPHTHTHTHTHNHTPKHTPKHSHMLTPTHPPTPTSAGDIGLVPLATYFRFLPWVRFARYCMSHHTSHCTIVPQITGTTNTWVAWQCQSRWRVDISREMDEAGEAEGDGGGDHLQRHSPSPPPPAPPFPPAGLLPFLRHIGLGNAGEFF